MTTFTIGESWLYPGAPSGRASAYGITPGHLEHAVVDGAAAYADTVGGTRTGDSLPSDYIDVAKIHAACDEALARNPTNPHLTFDEETSWSWAMTAYDEGRHELVDFIFDCYTAVYTEVKSYAPAVSVMWYSIVPTGLPAAWLDPTTYAASYADTIVRMQRLHQRWNGEELVPSPRDLCDIALYNVAARYPESESATQIAFMKAALQGFRTYAANGKPVWAHLTTHSYRAGTAGMAETGAYLKAQILAIAEQQNPADPDSPRYADGCDTWYQYEPEKAWDYFPSRARTTDAAAWAAVTSARFNVTLLLQTEEVEVGFEGVASMGDVAAALAAAVNAAFAGTNAGTVSVAWTSGQFRWSVDPTTGAIALPPGNAHVLSTIALDFNPGTGSDLGDSVMEPFDYEFDAGGPRSAIPGVDEENVWSEGWVLSGGEPVGWVAGLVEAAAELGDADEDEETPVSSSRGPAYHTSYVDIGGGDAAWFSPVHLSNAPNGIWDEVELEPGMTSNVARGGQAMPWGTPIPSNAVMVGLTATVTGQKFSAGTMPDPLTANVRPSNGTTAIGTTLSAALPAGGFGDVVIGSATDLSVWGLNSSTFTPAIANALRGLPSATNGDGTNTGSAAIDAIGYTVYFNLPPTVTVTNPTDGASYTTEQSITLTATAVDGDDASDLTAEIEWYKRTDQGGGVFLDAKLTLSGGAIAASDLGVGTHTLVAKVTAPNTLTGEDTVGVAVVEEVSGGGPKGRGFRVTNIGYRGRRVRR